MQDSTGEDIKSFRSFASIASEKENEDELALFHESESSEPEFFADGARLSIVADAVRTAEKELARSAEEEKKDLGLKSSKRFYQMDRARFEDGVGDFDDELSVYRKQKKRCPLIVPGSILKFLWDISILLFVLFNQFYVPFSVCFASDPSPGLFAFDVFCNVIFFVDIIGNFFTTFRRKGQWETSHVNIAKEYLKLWFWIDFIGTFPFDKIIGQRWAFFALFKAARLFRVHRLELIMDRFVHGLSSTVHIILMAVHFCTISHWFACMWYFMSVLQTEQGVESTWVTDEGLEDATILNRYFTSLYWSFTTFTSVGYGDIVPTTLAERLFSIGAMSAGAIFYAVIFGNITWLIQQENSRTSKSRETANCMNVFMQNFEVSSQLRSRVHRFFECSGDLIEDFQSAEGVMNEMPPTLRKDILFEIHEKMLRYNPVFVDADKPFLEKFASNLYLRVYFSQELIIRKGSVCQEMYFLGRGGEVKIINERDTMVALLKYGSYFGETCCMDGTPYKVAFQANTICNLYTLSKKNLLLILDAYPDLRQLMIVLARNRRKATGCFYDDDAMCTITTRNFLIRQNQYMREKDRIQKKLDMQASNVQVKKKKRPPPYLNPDLINHLSMRLMKEIARLRMMVNRLINSENIQLMLMTHNTINYYNSMIELMQISKFHKIPRGCEQVGIVQRKVVTGMLGKGEKIEREISLDQKGATPFARARGQRKRSRTVLNAIPPAGLSMALPRGN